MGIGGEHRQRVRRSDVQPSPDDQVAVAVAIRRRPEIGRMARHHRLIQRMGVDQIGVGVVTAEIR